MSKTQAVKKTYSSRKCVPRCEIVFDKIVNKTSASAAAVSVARWGQTTFTSVRGRTAVNGGNGKMMTGSELQSDTFEFNRDDNVTIINKEPKQQKHTAATTAPAA